MKQYCWNCLKSATMVVLLFSLFFLCTSCHLWYQDLKGYLEYWTDTVTVQGVVWNTHPVSQKNFEGIDTVSSNATITASVEIHNPENYELNYELGTPSDNLKSIRLSGVASNAVLANAKVISSSPTKMTVQIEPLSAVPTPESLALEHQDFTLQFNPTRSESGISASGEATITLRYNTPPRMPLAVIKDGNDFRWPQDGDHWDVATGEIYYAWPQNKTQSGGGNPTDPDYVTRFYIVDDGTAPDWYEEPDWREPTGATLTGADGTVYNIYWYLATGTTVTVYAEDGEGVRSAGTVSGELYKITLNAGSGTFGSGGDTSTIFKPAGSTINGNDLDVPTRSGYYLSGWATTAGGEPIPFPHTVSSGITLYALWTANPAGGENDIDYSITYNLDNGTNNPSNPLVYTVSQLPITLQAPTRSGYNFEGWYKDGNLVTEISLGTTGDITLTAKWSKPYDYYVDPAVGDDNNTGFSGSPLKTLQAAVDKIVADNDSSGTSFPYTINLLGDYDGAGAAITGESLIHVSSGSSLNLKISASGGNYTINAGRSSSDTGRVLYIDNIAHVTLENITLTGGYISDGGGAYVDGGSLTLGTGAVISNNTATTSGGGVYVMGGSLTLGTGAVISGNSATTSGGGIYLNGGSVTLSGNAQVTNNSSTSNGGGVYLNAGTFIMSDVSEISSNQASGSGGGVYVVSGATLSMDTSSSITNNTNSGMYGGGVYLAGTLTMTGGSISRNQSSSGAGVYANSAQAINMGGSAVITSDNDVQLGNGKCITITSSLTGTTPVATITPFNYTKGAQVLAADTTVTLADEVGKFGVVERDKISIWSIDDSGKLKTESITTTFPVVSDGDVAQSAQTVTISTGSKIGLPDSTTQDEVIAVLEAIVSSQHRDIILDLSRVTNLSEFRPTQACYSNNGCPISVIIFPSSVSTIETAMFQLAYSITIYFMDVESTWNIQDAWGQTQASFSVKENGGKSSSYLTSGYIWQKQ